MFLDYQQVYAEIEKEFEKINYKWMLLHYKTSIGMVLFSFMVELIVGVVLYNSGDINTTLLRYILKYIAFPTVLNVSFLVVTYWAIKNSNFKLKTKIYFTSLLLVALCFVVFSVHSIFNSLYLIFSIPILSTIVYGDYFLTTVTTIFSMLAKIISELFLTWDPDKISIWGNSMELTNFMIALSILCAFYAGCMVVIFFERQKNVVSMQKEVERHELKLKLNKDELTQINNRLALRIAFEDMEYDFSDTRYILTMVDIDNFKMLNDTLGHTKGDQILKELGQMLKLKSNGATPFRLGGDEFCILFKNENTQDVVNICRGIQTKFNQMVEADHIDLPLTLSFGIANGHKGIKSNQLLNNADIALYNAKNIKNSISVYKES